MNEARKKLADKFLKVLESGHIPWHQSWAIRGTQQYDALTRINYTGLTQMILSMENRTNAGWVLRSKALEKGWSIKPTARPVTVEEFRMCLLTDKTKTLSMHDFLLEATKRPNVSCKYEKVPVVYYLYNVEDIQGIPEKYKKQKGKQTVKYDRKSIDSIPTQLGVHLIEGKASDGMPTAYYMPSEDTVRIPNRSLFESEYSYTAVKVHELCHSTSAKNRLDRTYLYQTKKDAMFGGEGYAKEELRAEIASAFLMQDFGLKPTEKELTNHMGYVQSWISILRKDREELSKAIDDAYRIEEYILHAVGKDSMIKN